MNLPQSSILRGTVTGPEGEPLPGVVVKITSPVLMRSMETMTNHHGIYVLRDLPPGGYQVEFILEGFSHRVFEDVEIRLNDVNEFDVSFGSDMYLEDDDETDADSFDEDLGIEVQEDSASSQLVLETAPDSLPQGKIEQNIPTEMTQGVTEHIEVRISKDLKFELMQDLKGRGIPVEIALAVSTLMKVLLQGDQDFFRIDSLSTEEQIVGETDYTEWEWDVTPLASGEGSLRLLAIVVLAVEGAGPRSRDLISLDKTVVVAINVPWIVRKFLRKYWPWIIGTIIALIGAITAVITFFKPT